MIKGERGMIIQSEKNWGYVAWKVVREKEGKGWIYYEAEKEIYSVLRIRAVVKSMRRLSRGKRGWNVLLGRKAQDALE